MRNFVTQKGEGRNPFRKSPIDKFERGRKRVAQEGKTAMKIYGTLLLGGGTAEQKNVQGEKYSIARQKTLLGGEC